jgi:hypothetical protein
VFDRLLHRWVLSKDHLKFLLSQDIPVRRNDID